jgi:predicted MFS family arabinose efflux permease
VVVTRWFEKHRGLAMGILTASTATGQLIFLPILAKAVESDGWRTAVRIVAFTALAALGMALFFVRESPAAAGIPAFGGTEVIPLEPPVENPARVALRTLGRAAKREDFWFLSSTFFICGASTNGLIGTHLIPACVDHGIPEDRAAGLLATMGLFDLAGTTMSGWFTDRFDGRKLLFTYYALRGVSLMFLPRVLEANAGLFIFAIFYGLDWIATVPPTMRLATESFGVAEGPIVFGWVVAMHQVGAGIAALGAGVARTAYGDYQFAFISAGALCLLAALLSLAVGRVRFATTAPATP